MRAYNGISLNHLEPNDPGFTDSLRAALNQINLWILAAQRELSPTQGGSVAAEGATIDEPYVVMAPTAGLNNERTLTAVSPLGVSDGGPGGSASVLLAGLVPISKGGTDASTANGAFDNIVGIDSNGNRILARAPTTSAVNYLSITNAATGGGPQMQALGSDSDIDLSLQAKGAGGIAIDTAFIDKLERSAPGSPGAGHLRHYSKAFGNATRPYIKDENGTEFIGMQPRTVYKSSDESTSATSLADVSGMTFSLEPSKTYHFIWHIFVTTDADTTGVKFTVNMTNSPTYIIYAMTCYDAGANHFSQGSTTKNTALTTSGSMGTVISQVTLKGTIINSNNSDSLVLRFATTAAFTGVTCKKGSWGVISEVP